jgi:hypothetical protein
MSATSADPRELEALEARFFDVICEDEELLAAEFEAIVSAGCHESTGVPARARQRSPPSEGSTP